MTRQKDSFVFYRSFKECMSELNDSDKLVMYEAISDYALDRVEPELTGFPKMLFKLIRPQLDANFRRWENGCSGGAPKGIRNNPNGRRGKGTNQELTKNKPNVNDNVKENDNDSIKENNKKKVTQSITEEELSFVEKMKAAYPRVMSMKEPLTLKQLKEISEIYGNEAIKDKLLEMENWESLSKKHSANLTLRNWLRRDNLKK